MKYEDRIYDNWKTTNPAEEEAARYEMALEAKAAEIRSDMKLGEWWGDIEEDLCTLPMYKLAMMNIICGNYDLGGAEVKKLADAWLDNRAVELAAEALAGGGE